MILYAGFEDLQLIKILESQKAVGFFLLSAYRLGIYSCNLDAVTLWLIEVVDHNPICLF